MRPLSPSPMTTGIRQRYLMSDDAFAGDEGSSRSSSLPPHSRVAFNAINTLAPCSIEFQRSLNDLTMRDDENNSSVGRLTLPIIQVLRNSEAGALDGKTRQSCWDDDSSVSSKSNSEEDINKSWTSLSGVGTLVTLPRKGKRSGRKAASENMDAESMDDTISVRSDSYMMCKNSPSSRRKFRAKADSSNREDKLGVGEDMGRLSRKDEGPRTRRKTHSGLEPPTSNARSRGLSPISRPQKTKDGLSRPPIQRCRSAHTSPHRDMPKIDITGTNSAPTSPYGSPTLNRAIANPKRAAEPPKWQMSFKPSTSPPANPFSMKSLDPILTNLDGTTGRYANSSSTSGGGQRSRKDKCRACKLSDLYVRTTRQGQNVINLEEEFKRLRTCRYIRGNSDEKEFYEAE